VVKDIEEAIAHDEVPSLEYRPSPRANSHIIRSLIQFRPCKKKSEGRTCASAMSSFSSKMALVPVYTASSSVPVRFAKTTIISPSVLARIRGSILASQYNSVPISGSLGDLLYNLGSLRVS
jgi:hypothetical protein